VAKTSRERDYEAREAKLEHVRRQVASGELVIRTMTHDEREKWAEQDAMVDANSTPADRVRRADRLESRRKRAERFS
jgi:hypothetical protein